MTETEKLTGDALEQALTDRGLPSEGTADEKRAAVAEYDAAQAAQPPADAGTGDTAQEALAKVPDATPSSVASPEQNAALEHTEGGTTTRADATDVGVPMLPGSPTEPQGPEDALGPGPKRGDYSGRVGPSGYNPTQTERIPDAAPGEPHTRVVDQRPRAYDQGEVPGEKGGVTTAPDAATATP